MLPISRPRPFAARRSRSRLPGALLLFVMALRAAVAGAAGGIDEPAAYVVGPNDVLAITVFSHPDLTGRYTVQDDGTFTFPLLGRVSVSGMTVQAVEDDIRARLSRGYLVKPQVGVAVDQYRSQQIFVMGEVRTPGGLQFTGSMTLVEALARVGSTTERAGPEAIIVRPRAGAPTPTKAAVDLAQASRDSEVIRIDLAGVETGQSQAVSLRSGDTIIVQRANPVFVSGHVVAPGQHVINKGMTVRQVIALAGGATERGSDKRVQIIRKVDGQDRTINAKLEDVVQPGDTVVVRERFF